MDSSSIIIDTTQHNTYSCAVIGDTGCVSNVIKSIRQSRNYNCRLAVAEGYFAKNFRKIFSRSGFKTVLRLSADALRLWLHYRNAFRGISNIYFNCSDTSKRLFDAVPDREFDGIDIFFLACKDSPVRKNYKVSDYAAGLLRRGISREKIFVVPDVMSSAELPVISDEKISPLCRKLDDVRPVLRTVDYHVTDFCNLKCKGCRHLAEHVKKLEFFSAESFRMSLEKLREKFSNIERIYLMGGEPLLCRQLHEYIDAAHDVFPYSNITIVTNGLLIRNITPLIVQSIHKAGAAIEVTQYPPTRKMADEIISFCEENGIKLVFRGQVVKEFSRRRYSEKNNNPLKIWSSCEIHYCHILHGTVLFPCSHIWTSTEPMFRDILGKDALTDEDRREYSYDLSENIADDGWTMLMKFDNPMRLCSTCGEKIFFKWESEAGIK